MQESDRVIVWDEPEYIASYHTADLGEGRVMTLFHLDVFYFSASILRQMLTQWQVFREHVNCVLYCMGNEDDDRFRRFVSYFGFTPLSTIPCTDGKTRTLFVHHT